MATVVTSGKRPLDFVLSEANGKRSRDNIVIASGAGVLPSGTVLGMVTASGKFVPVAPAAADGSEDAVAVLGYEVDATSADVRAVGFTRDCEVNRHQLVWPAGISAPNQTAAINSLATKGITVR